MDYKVEDIREAIQKNLDILKKRWQTSCQAFESFEKSEFESFEKSEYSNHLILILTDLQEEIKTNLKNFDNHTYGRQYFASCIEPYYDKNKNNNNKNKGKKSSAKIKWTEKISSQLNFICEILKKNEPKADLDYILILIERVQKEIYSSESFDIILELLMKEIEKEEKLDEKELQFIVDTVLILFLEKGYHVKTLKYLLQKQLNSFANHWNLISNHGLNRYNELIYDAPRYTEDQSKEDYFRILKEYYDSLTLKNRFLLLQKIYSQKPQKYKVVFQVLNPRFVIYEDKSLAIGNVYFYNPKNHGKIIKPSTYKSNNEQEKIFYEDFNQKVEDFENNDKINYCVSIDVEGIDYFLMKNWTREKVERAISVFLEDASKGEIKISDNFVVCDEQGEALFFNYESSNLKLISEYSYDYTLRTGQWLSSITPLHESIETWFTAIELYRKSVESGQSSDELLYSWFSIEHFINKSEENISMTLPKFLGDDICKRRIGSDKISTIQLLLAILTIKYHLHIKIVKLRREIAGRNYSIADEMLYKFCHEDRSTYDKNLFIENFDLIWKHLKDNNPDKSESIDQRYKALNEKETCIRFLRNTISDVKDDVYNIYRLRNMLVHLSKTKSKLINYYSKRSQEYSEILLLEIRKYLLQTKDDNEVKSIPDYFREIILDANLAFESLDKQDINQFRKWIIS